MSQISANLILEDFEIKLSDDDAILPLQNDREELKNENFSHEMLRN